MKDWSNNVPPWTNQYDVKSRTDVQDCASESIINVIYMLTGFDASPRALAKLSGTTLQGNSTANIINTINKYGLIPYELWPTPSDFDWKTYYDTIPQEVLNRAIPCRISLVAASLDVSPLWTEIAWGLNLPVPTRHMVAQLNETEYFDSEQGSPIKPLNYEGAEIVYQTSLNIKLMITCKTVKFADGKTMGMLIDSPNGCQIIKATDEAQWRSWNLSTGYGKPTVNPDGTTNWEAELTLNF